MDDRIAALSPEQAERVVGELFDLLPKDAFGGEKPSLVDLQDLTREARETAPADLKPFLSSVVDGTGPEIRGEVARVVLDEWAQLPDPDGRLDQAIDRASQPHMGIGLLIGVVVLAMTVMPKKAKFKDGKLESIEFGHLLDGTAFVKELAGFVKTLPLNVKSFLGGA